MDTFLVLFLMTKIELSKKLKKDSANHSAMIVTNGQHFYQMVDCLCAIIKLPMQRLGHNMLACRTTRNEEEFTTRN